jgi:Flp pilus assembly protein TadG
MRNIFRSQSGVATVEVAIFLSFMALVFSGVVDYSAAMQEAMRVQEAAAAGAAYGAVPGNQDNLTGMQNAAIVAASGISGFTAVASDVYYCIPGGTPVSYSTICPSATNEDAGTPIKYVVVTTSATVPPMFAYPGLTAHLKLQGSASFRVPWSQ